jgi:hypothetical protein
MTFHPHTAGRRACVGRLFVSVAMVLAIGLQVAPLKATDAGPSREAVTVREERGVYCVVARFQVPQTFDVVRAVLTDYDGIPRFMPGVKRSTVLDRAPGRAVVEQEAVSRLMMLSKRVHIVLEIAEGSNTLTFHDRCGRSFSRYEGSWHLSQGAGVTDVRYELTAQPSFDVPEFLLKRLLKRDSADMIEGLRREIAARAAK